MPPSPTRSYLALDEVLGAQRPRSDEHDELLFIVVHQVYELWFKQLLHELAPRPAPARGRRTRPPVVHTLRRVLTILKVAVAQIDVLETMTPRQFTGFRDRLEAASGFQSAQFRELEAVLGRRDRGGARRATPADSPARRGSPAAMARPLAVRLLPRVPRRPRLRRSRRQHCAATCTSRRRAIPSSTTCCSPCTPTTAGRRRCASGSSTSTKGIQEWRYRHVKMVERTIGDKSGHRRVVGRGLPAQHAVHPAVPRSVGDPQPALTSDCRTGGSTRRPGGRAPLRSGGGDSGGESSSLAARRTRTRVGSPPAMQVWRGRREPRRGRRSSRAVTTMRRGRRGRPPRASPRPAPAAGAPTCARSPG